MQEDATRPDFGLKLSRVRPRNSQWWTGASELFCSIKYTKHIKQTRATSRSHRLCTGPLIFRKNPHTLYRFLDA